jgi:hypothetical protein
MRHVLYIPVRLAAIHIAFILVTVIALAQTTGSQRQDLSLLRLGVFLSSVKATEVIPARRLIPMMHWGARDSSGLQLGAYYNPQMHLILCFIRNAGARAVTMNAYQFGCGGYIKVYARIAGATQWTEVSGGTCAHGAGPSARDNVTVQPGQYLIRDNLQFGDGTEQRTITRIECSFLAIAVTSRIPPNPDLEPVELRVEHILPNDGSRDVWQGALLSAVLTVPAKTFPTSLVGAPGSKR